MPAVTAKIIDVSGNPPRPQRVWPASHVGRPEIERTIEKLADLAPPPGGHRCARIVHPWAASPGLGFAPGIDVAVNVLKPGEATAPIRQNSSRVDLCIGGTGIVQVEGNEPFEVEKWDVWNIPSMKAYSYRNSGDSLWVRLSYSDAPLLEDLEVHFVDDKPAWRPGVEHLGPLQPSQVHAGQGQALPGARLRDTAANFALTTGGWLRGYQYAVDVDVVETGALLWPWTEVAPHLPLQEPGHPAMPMAMYLLYNPATGRSSGTTHSFFTTMTCLKAGGPRPREGGRGHRHNSAAINYHMKGRGYSVVDGERIDWAEGDLLLSAPGWSEHAHFPDSSEMIVFTVQDHPRHMNLGSLIWQEQMNGPILNVGGQKGFNSSSPRNDIS